MIDKPTRIGNSELYNARVLNMGVAKYFDIVKEYVEILSETRQLNKKELEKNGEQAELNLYYSVRYNLNLLKSGRPLGVNSCAVSFCIEFCPLAFTPVALCLPV